MKKILFLPISDREGASSRYRVYQYIPFLEQAGFDVRVMPPSKDKGRGITRLLKGMAEERAIINAAQSADVVFIQKRLFGKGFVKRLSNTGVKMVFDFDDSIFTSPTGDWSGPTKSRVSGRLSAVLGISDMVVAGNAFLRDYAVGAGAGRVEVIPTGLDLAGYRLKEHGSGKAVVLGWIGSSVNHPYLDMLKGVLPVMAKEYDGLRLLVVSDKDYKMDGVTVENRRWSEATEIDDLLSMDIGLMPLTDTEWTRGKCAFKAIQYMAAGIPVVCSPVGANVEAVQDSVEGFLPGTEQGWLDALGRLITSHGLRAEMGSAGRAKVERSYSVTALNPIYIRMLKELQNA